MRRRVNQGRHVYGDRSPQRVPWWDLPGVFALLVVGGGLPVLLGAYSVTYVLINGEWPAW